MAYADEAIAQAVRAIALANALGWVTVAQLLEEKGVTDRETFGKMLNTAADILTSNNPPGDPHRWSIGAEMLRMAHDNMRKANPPKPFKPTLVK